MSNNSILNINKKLKFDDSIRREEWHVYDTYSSTKYDYNDEVRIPIHFQDIYTTLHDSNLLIEGKFVKETDGTAITNGHEILSTNGFAFLFDEIRYELFGVEIDKVKNVGITTTIKSFISMSAHEKLKYAPSGWDYTKIINPNGEFLVSIPLKQWLGFFEDFRDIIANAKQELILVRSRTDNNCYVNEEKLKVEISKIQWRVKHVYPSDEEKLKLLNVINKNETLYLPFRSWNIFEYPQLPLSSKQSWSIKTTTQLEKPRYVILAFQSNRKNNNTKDNSKFDHCELRDIKLYLNSEYYPYENLNINFAKNNYQIIYDMYLKFQKSYYNNDSMCPLVSWEKFKEEQPLIVIDCSRQSEALKSATVDIRLDFESTNNFPDNTTAYCLILSDSVAEYKPLSGQVKKLV